MQRLGKLLRCSVVKTTNFSHHTVTGGVVSGRSTVTDSLSTNPYSSFAKLSKPEGAETDLNLNNEQECSIKGYIVFDVSKDTDKNFTSSISTFYKQNDRTFKAKASSDALETSNQAASKSKELTFPTCTIVNQIKWTN